VQENFHGSSASRLSRVHGLFAKRYARQGNHAAAARAATIAIEQQKRNADARETMIEASQAAKADPSVIEKQCRDAAKTFRRYPDVEAGFFRRLVAEFTARGDVAKASAVRKEIIQRNRTERPDLALSEAVEELSYAMKNKSTDEQVKLFKSQLSRFRNAGMITGFRLVEPFVRHLKRQGETAHAKAMIKHTRSRLDVTPDLELGRLLERLEVGL